MSDQTQIRKGAHAVGSVGADELPPAPSGPGGGAAPVEPSEPVLQAADEPVGMQIPLVVLPPGTQMMTQPLEDGNRMLMIGPIMLGVPLGPDAARALARGLAGGVEPASTLTPADRAAGRALIVKG